MTRPLKWVSIASQRANAPEIRAKLSGSASAKWPMVCSEKTTPQPQVTPRGFFSTTVMSTSGRAFLNKIAL